MKFLMLEWHLSSRRGGMELAMYQQCAQLKARGHDVAVAYNASGDLQDKYAALGIPTTHLPTYTPVRKHLVRDALYTAVSLARTVPLDLDVVAANSYQSTFFGALLARAKRIPLACHLRLLAPEDQTAPARFGLTQVSHFIAVSEYVRQDWIRRGVPSDAISVVHEGIDLERFRPLTGRDDLRRSLGILPGDFAVVVCSRLDHGKDIEGALRTFARLHQVAPNARLLIAGRPVDHLPGQGELYVESLKRLSSDLGISNRVSWLGHRSDMPALYNAADVVALFGKTPEPFGLVTCEALACGRPIVTPRQGGSAEILTGEFATLMFDPARPDDAVAVFRSLVDWQRRDASFGERARAHIAAHFNVASMGARMESVFDQIVRAGPVRAGFRLTPTAPRVETSYQPSPTPTLG